MRISTAMEPEPARKKTAWVRGIHGGYTRSCGIFDLRVTDHYPHFTAEIMRHFCYLYTSYAVDGVTDTTYKSVEAAQKALERAVAGLCYGALEDLGDDISGAHRQGLLAFLEKPPKAKRVARRKP